MCDLQEFMAIWVCLWVFRRLADAKRDIGKVSRVFHFCAVGYPLITPYNFIFYPTTPQYPIAW
jgi:hypothetical protein